MATTNTQPTTRNGGPAVGDPQAASENDMSASQTGQTAADGSASDQGIRTRMRLAATPARMTRGPAAIRVQPVAVHRVQRTRPVAARMAVERVRPARTMGPATMGPAPTTEPA
jgi:hypothetical protein